ncbi:alkaline-phosphatase-like protein [Mariannaea sp. PMI_226]|nr:alkaline-phosphatase-like protein [Mariannaea sp. PMI_226]
MFATFIPFCFSLIFVSLTFTKLVHLSIHISTVPPLAFILYLPSLLLPDVFIIYLSRLALRRKSGAIGVAACTLGCTFAFVLLGAASSQLGFWYKTGNEVQWSDALNYAGDKDGMKILLSGLSTVLTAGLLILVVSWLTKWYLYRAVGTLTVWVGAPVVYLWQVFRGTKARGRYQAQSASTSPDPYESDSDFDDSDDGDETKEESSLVFGQDRSNATNQTTVLAIFAGVLVFLTLTTVLRPSTPYNMMSATLPLAMMEMFKSAPDLCSEQAALSGNRWPFPELINQSKWEYPSGHFKGWAPGNNEFVQQYRSATPDWLPEILPSGFQKWTPTNTTQDEAETTNKTDSCIAAGTDGAFYNPVNDPLKITNLDNDILEVLKDQLSGGNVKIKHVALIMLESFREELFPLQYGSDMHSIIMKSYKNGKEDEINARLSQLGPVAERITGKSGNFKKKDGSDFDPVSIPQWNDTTPEGFGGINVVGGFTTSSLSFKSMAAIHCGAWSMPVDSFEESETQSYQPCIPQVLDLFNNIKADKSTDDFLEQQWLPAFFQSITDGYDRQRKFDKKIGFKHIVTKDRLEDDAGVDDDLEEINYFGYAETTLKSHIVDYIKQIQKEGKRMFFSHFTSTTHHPWGVPSSFQKTEYLNTKDKMSWHEDFDNYLNAIRFTDAWLGELLQTFDDFGMSNETLVVFVGDHGQAFKEDDSKTGTYENGHVSNFRVPITFRHPKIPRVQYNANASSISILPTILDLLINTGSLNEKDTNAASDLVQDYEGQSLIRPYKASHNGRRAWNFGIINGGGRMLSLTSADAPWRLVIPLDQKSEYRFTDLEHDPLELKPLEKWAIKNLANAVKYKFGEDASQWAIEAEAVGRWWGLERKRLWAYKPGDSDDED